MQRIFAVFGLLMIGVLVLYPPIGPKDERARKRDESFCVSTPFTDKETGQAIEVDVGPLFAIGVVAGVVGLALWSFTGKTPSRLDEAPRGAASIARLGKKSTDCFTTEPHPPAN